MGKQVSKLHCFVVTRDDKSLMTHDNSYRIIKKVGAGAFGEVYLGRYRDTNDMIAVKKTFQDPKFANREGGMCKKLNHVNIVRFHSVDYVIEDDKKYLILIMDYYPHCLQNIIDLKAHRNTPFHYNDLQYIAKSIFRGLEYMHSNQVVHRDIKPDNILINIKEKRVVIADLGSAKNVYDGTYNKSYICSRIYRAPELVLGCGKYTELIDIWSVGCVIAECILLKPLFSARSNDNLLTLMETLLGTLADSDKRKLKSGRLEGIPVSHRIYDPIAALGKASTIKFTPELKSLLSDCLQWDPQTRLNARELAVRLGSFE